MGKFLEFYPTFFKNWESLTPIMVGQHSVCVCMIEGAQYV